MKVLALLLIALPASAHAADTAQRLDSFVDSFDSVAEWAAIPAGKARAAIARERDRQGSSMRVDFDFTQGGGEIIVHRHLPLTLPDNYAVTFRLRGTATQPLEVRLVDASGQNVWRYEHPEFRIPPAWRTIRVKQRQFAFGWGPAAGGKPRALGLVEFVIGRGAGSRGSIWIDDLGLEPRPPDRPDTGAMAVKASSALPERSADRLLASADGPGWHSAPGRRPQWLQLDFAAPREYGGLVLDWDADDYASHYVVERSDDGRQWEPAYTVTHGNGGRDYLPLPESESRFLRLRLLRSHRGQGFGLRRLEVAPLAFSASSTPLFERIARDAERGRYPRYLLGEQSYWTIAGSAGSERAGARREALLSVDGQLETDEGAFTIEPFLYFDGRLHTWADAQSTPSLARGDLPVPSVRLAQGEATVTVTALAGSDSSEDLLARYEVENHGQRPLEASLFLAVRPFLVNPPWQATHTAGGVSSIHRLRYRNGCLWVDGHPAVIPLAPPDRVGVLGFDEAPLTSLLARDQVPATTAVDDAAGKASGALRYHISLPPGGKRALVLALPAREEAGAARRLADAGKAPGFWTRARDRVLAGWAAQVDRVQFQVPPSAEDGVRALRSTLAHILVNRDGPALRPGSRRYGRTWIRDAAVTSSALLALGHAAEVREFIDGFVRYQGADGAIPCCLDPWGPDSMIEHDSAGEFVYTVASYVRYTHDRPFLERLWPNVVRSVEYLIALRQQRLAPAYAQGEARRFFGLLPESASHEGYIGHPVHAYWDDFWALRGFEDAAWLAAQRGDAGRAARYADIGKAMRADVEQSIGLTQARFKVDYLPGAAELGDLDPTSAAIAPVLGLTASPALLPTLRATFRRYFAEVEARSRGESLWKAYTPYEFRNVSAMVRLGERDAAQGTLRALLDGRRPVAWNQWPEVVWRDPAPANFIGDLPHTWVGAEFIQAFLSQFAYEEAGRRLVLAAGLPRAWLETPGGSGITGLRTPFGRLSYHLEALPGETRMTVAAGPEVPADGLVVDPPLPSRPVAITVNGVPVPVTQSPPTIRELPARIVFRH